MATPEEIAAAEKAKAATAAPAAAPKTRYNDDPAKIAAAYSSQSNPLMRSAAAKGLATANRRGLMNSSIAAGAAQKETLDVVVPMAMQKAEFNANKNLEKDKLNYQKQLNRQSLSFEKALARQGHVYNKDIESDRFGYQTELNEQNYGYEKSLSKLNQDAQLRLAQEGWDVEKEMTQWKIDWDKELASMNIGADNQKAAGTAFSSIWDNWTTMNATILNNEKIPAAERTKLLNSARSNMMKSVKMTEALYSVEVPEGLFR